MKKNRISRLIKGCSFTFIFLSHSIFLLGQNDFFEGYIIKNNKDTVYGYINLGGGVQNAHECIFKKDLDSNSIKYLPSEIFGYRFLNGKYYVSEMISYEINSDQAKIYKNFEIDRKRGTYNVKDNLTEEMESDNANKGQNELVNENVFLEFLINGNVDVYVYYENYRNLLYFVKKGEDSLIHLKNTKADLYSQGSIAYTTEKKEYFGILNYMLQDCKEIQSKIVNTDLNNESLIKLSKYYHNQTCNNPDEPCIIYEKVNRKIYISVIPTISYSKMKVSASKLHSVYDYEFINQKNFSYGLNLKFSNFQYLNYHLTGQTGIIYQNQYFESEDNRTRMEFKVLEFPLELNYSFLKNLKLNPFIGFSGNFNFRIANNIESTIYQSDHPILKTKILNIAYSGIAGIDYYFTEDLFLSSAVQYKIGGTFYNWDNDNSKSNTFLIRVGFGFVISKTDN